MARRLERLFLALLALRLCAAVLLVAPWAGFDEAFHHGVVETNEERVAWPSFRGVDLPDRLCAEFRRWPLPPALAPLFGSRPYGDLVSALRPPSRQSNYETLQSPAYYFAAGRVLRLIPALSPIAELYLLRFGNALAAFFVGWVAALSARKFGFGDRAFLPVAFLALTPGFSVALTRVSNDAACAVLISFAFVLALEPSETRRLLSSLAAGASPWAKLYGAVLIPPLAGRALGRPRRAIHLALLTIPGIALAVLSWKIHGQPLALQENIRRAAPAPLSGVPWLRDVWTIAKTHVWVSGMSFTVFPALVYVPVLAILAAAGISGLRRSRSTTPPAREALKLSALTLAFLAIALAYFCWRNFTYFRSPGGVGGWYIWAFAVPESLILTHVATRKGNALATALGTGFYLWLLGVTSDLISIVDVSGKLRTNSSHVLVGLNRVSLAEIAKYYFASRPHAVAVMALATCAASWLMGLYALMSVWRISDARLASFQIQIAPPAAAKSERAAPA